MKIAFFKPHYLAYDYVKEWENENKIKVDIIDEKLSLDNLDILADYDGLAMTLPKNFDNSIYGKLHGLGIKQIALTSVGYDIFDIEKARENDIIITNVPDYSPESIAEFTIMMILKALKRDKEIQKNLKDNDYRQKANILGQTFKGKTLGIYGLGRIGQDVARIADAFGANVVSYSSRGKKDIDGVTFLSSYDELLKESDIITIHSALTEENYHFFDKEAFAKMKDGAMLFNCARGGLINTEDLLDAIDSGKVAFAGLDVYENEKVIYGKKDPNYQDYILDRILSNDRVDYYPHITYLTSTSLENQVKYALNAVVEVLETGDSKNRIN